MFLATPIPSFFNPSAWEGYSILSPTILSYVLAWYAYLLQHSSLLTNSRLTALNRALNEFYYKVGAVTAAEEWVEKHPYNKAFDDSLEDWITH